MLIGNRHPNNGKAWGEDEDKVLELAWVPGMKIEELSETLGRTREAIARRAHHLGLKNRVRAGNEPE